MLYYPHCHLQSTHSQATTEGEMTREVQQHSILIRDLIQEAARRLGFTEPSIAAKVAKQERGVLEHHDDLLVLDTFPEIFHEVHDLHNYLVTHAAQHGF